MRQQLESLMLALAVGSSAAIGAKRIGVPYNVALVLVGLVLVFVDVLPTAALDPNLVLLVFLPILVFEGALFADADHLRRASRPILILAIPGVVLSLLGTAAFATWILDLPFIVALLLGALLAITDTVSVLLAFRSVRVPHRLAAIMEGESLFNDGTALVLVSLCAVVVTTGNFVPSTTLRSLLVAIVGGGLVGGAFAAIGAAVLRRTPDHLTSILASVVLVFATSLLAERVHASPVIAVVVAGLYIGNAARKALEPSRVLALQGFWETIGFSVNVILFLLVGMQIHAELLLEEGASIALALIALHGGRAVAVYGSFAVLRVGWKEVIPLRWQHVMVFGNIKGALSMAAVLALPVEVPYRSRLITIVFGITFVTLVMQALPFKRFLQWLRVVDAPADLELDAAKATLISAKRGQADLDVLLDAGLVSRKDHAARRASFQRHVIDAERVLRASRGAHAGDHVVDAALLVGRKAALQDASRRGLIDASVAEAQINDLDRELMDLGKEEGNHT
ncbi:MAG: sodium:proton antiporter [Polyangiaceae bacterium]|nr:sodium:proton antiporter [Polyangiaceae bacterium]